MYPISKKCAHLFGLGWSHWAPGTMGSLGACLLWPLFMIVPEVLLWPLWMILCVLALWVCFDVLEEMTDKDPSWVVIDEALAVWLIPVFYQGLFSSAWIIAWLLFRIIDITKPWPVSASERMRPPALAVVLDDVVAVMLALLLTEFWWGH